ncbi:MAG: GNAT family N-acetyltransferase [Candidatus Woesearchaeota archaeon]|nr:MAG: GNAT family N-acetyltransferase [Candidatus Woesearchaeota archaeon]
MKLEIRKFKEEDAEDFCNLVKRNLNEVNSKDYPEEVIRFMCNLFSPEKTIEVSKKKSIYVAIKNNRMAGTDTIDKNEILVVFVNPDLHGKGTGTKIMKHLEDIAKKNGYESVKLYSSITAYEFYKKLGYKKLKEVYRKGFGKGILMEKSIIDG